MTTHPKPEVMAQVAELAGRLTWKQPDLKVLREERNAEYSPLALALQNQILLSDARGKLVLPDLRAFGNQSVGTFSDYGGETASKFNTYSTLVCGLNLIGPFSRRMNAVRASHGLGDKEIAFKDFRMGQMRRALPDYLTALNNLLPGFLCTLAVDKRFTSLFGPQAKSTKKQIAEALKAEGLGEWKPDVAEKLVRIVHLTSFLTTLLAHDGQKIFWMTDHDEICSNQDKHGKALTFFQRGLGIFARPNCKFPIIGGAVPFAERSVEMLDLLSITDVVAGALDQYLTKRDSADVLVKEGADLVLQWLAHDGVGLKKLNLIMRPGGGGVITAGTLEFSLVNPPEGATIIPVVV
ncbi:MAG TPA: hypothetical protein VGU20_18980 [Stellaceae bacterium]|nr:hypothetical protein [Stellaceae bacterium]